MRRRTRTRRRTTVILASRAVPPQAAGSQREMFSLNLATYLECGGHKNVFMLKIQLYPENHYDNVNKILPTGWGICFGSLFKSVFSRRFKFPI